MALDYIIYFIILENMVQYSINLYHLTQIFYSRHQDDPPIPNSRYIGENQEYKRRYNRCPI